MLSLGKLNIEKKLTVVLRSNAMAKLILDFPAKGLEDLQLKAAVKEPKGVPRQEEGIRGGAEKLPLSDFNLRPLQKLSLPGTQNFWTLVAEDEFH